MMMQPQALDEQIKAGNIPNGWQLLRTKSSFFVGNIGLGAFLILASIAAAIYLFISNTVVGYGVSKITTATYLLIWQVLDNVILLGFLIGGIVMIVRFATSLSQADQQYLAHGAAGFVMRKGSQPNQTTQFSFADVARMTTTMKNGTLSLVVTRTNGKEVSIDLDGRYGPPKKVAEAILASFALSKTATAPVASPTKKEG